MFLIPAVIFALVLAALIDIIVRQDGQVKHLPKLVWVLLVILLPLIGSIIWFAVGREYTFPVNRGTFGDPRRREGLGGLGTGAGVGAGAGAGAGAADGSAAGGAGMWRGAGARAGRKLTTEEELAELDREIEFHAKQARIAALQARLDERHSRAD